MKRKKFFAWLLTAALVLGMLPVSAMAASNTEQFPTLTPGETYWFDLSRAGILGAVNEGVPDNNIASVPDITLHWVPFTYAGTINAYKLTSPQEATKEYAEANRYDHSLFIADYNVAHTVNWKDLNSSGLIFGKSYTSNGVGYTMRVPSVGSYNRISAADGSEFCDPESNEWDLISDKGVDYIKNWNMICSWGQDTTAIGTSDTRMMRGSSSARSWGIKDDRYRDADVGFRPVLELPAPDALTPDSLKVVTLNLNGGKAGTTDTAQNGPVNIVVASSGSFTAPSSEGLTRPAGNTDSYFKWRGDDGSFYAAGASVPASVSTLTAQWEPVNLSGAAVTVSGSYPYTGQAIEPPVTVTLNGTTLAEGTDYTVSYTNNVDIGTASITVTGTGNYTGTAKGTFTIGKAAQAALSITGAPAAIYNGDSFTLTVSGGSGGGAVTWEVVSGPAAVDENGTVTVTGTGEIQIKAVKAADANYTQAEAAITLNALASSTAPSTQYLVTVNGGTGGGSYAEGAAVTITATVPSGQRFTGWTVNEGGVTLANASSATTTFTMPAQAVTVTANFRSNSGGGGGGGSYTPPTTTYPPTVEKPSEGGTVTVSPSRPSTGDKVTVRPKPDSGYAVEKVTVTDKNGRPVTVTKNPDGTYSFTQPNGTVNVEVIYQSTETPWSNPFRDVTETAWYYEAVRYVSENGLMNGYSDGRFGSDDNLSRAQLAQILFNKEGRPGVNYLLQFGDVSGEAWYTEAVRWATSQGIVGGYGNGMFGPNDPITREQLAVMLWRYSGSPAATNKELHFNDTDEISLFALEALHWAVENGILNGYSDGRLGPQGQATRAQVAQMLMNFLNNR